MKAATTIKVARRQAMSSDLPIPCEVRARDLDPRRISALSADRQTDSNCVPRLRWGALALLFVPLIIEALALEPTELLRFREPIQAAWSLVSIDVLPYLAVALTGAVLAFGLRYRGERTVPRSRSSLALGVLAAALSIAAAFLVRPFSDSLLAGDAHVSGDHVWLGSGGLFTPSLALTPVGLEEAGALVDQVLPEQPSPWTATVRWIGVRTSPEPIKGNRIDLLAGGSSVDVTDDFASLRPGEARLFTYHVRVGPAETRVRLRLAQDPLPPIDFFSTDYESDVRGIAIDAGGGDRAYRTASTVVPQPRGGGRFEIEGSHAAGGYAVIVLSGEEWRPHDLSGLLTRGGRLDLTFSDVTASAWTVRLVGDGVQSDAVPLTRFTRTAEANHVEYSLPLKAFALGEVPPTAVVGIALTYAGDPGPFTLELLNAQAALRDSPATGLAIATTGALDPGARPAQAWFAAGDEPTRSFWYSHVFQLRLIAAALALIAVIGVRGAWQLITARPVTVAVALLSAPMSVVLLPGVIRLFAEPRVEQLPLALAVLTIGLLIGSRAQAGRSPAVAATAAVPVSVAKQKFAWMDALKGLGILSVIAIHVTADAAGLPYVSFAPPARVVPAVLRALASSMNYMIFVIASLFLLAHTLESRGPTYAALIRERVHRLMPPFLAWSAIYVVFRFVKASAFGYADAYRAELAHGVTWPRYLLLGSAQYHLHFLPLLMALVLLFPLFRPARRRPAWALLLLPLLALWPMIDGLAYQYVASPEWRDYALQLTKIAAFAGYGLLAFALYGLWRDERLDKWRRPLLGAAIVIAVAALSVLVHAAFDVAAAGEWLPNTLAAHMALYLAPASLFVLLLLSGSVRWPQWLLQLGGLSFAIYLFHPVILDLLEILERGARTPPLWTVAVNFVAVTSLSSAVVLLSGRYAFPRWLLGLGAGYGR